MTEFVASPMFDAWLVRHPPRESLVLCSPFLAGGTLERVAGLSGRRRLRLRVLFRGLKRDFLQGATDLAALEVLERLEREGGSRAEIRLLANLHMKGYLVDGRQLLITSGNCTRRGFERAGAEGNVEGGIATDEPAVIAAFLDYFQRAFAAAVPLGELIGQYRTPEFRERVLAALRRQPRQGMEPGERGSRCDIPAAAAAVPAPAAAERGRAYYIPQNYKPEALEKTLDFLYQNRDSPAFCTKERLAELLGSQAEKKDDRDRKLTGLVKNMRLLGLVEDRDCRNDRLPPLTALGRRCAQGDREERRGLLRGQIMALPWFNEVVEQMSGGQRLDRLLLEYLCGDCGYSRTTADRYVPAMKHLLGICGIGEEG